MYFKCCFCTCHSVSFHYLTYSKVVYWSLVCEVFSKLLLALDLSYFICSLIHLPLCWSFVVWQFILRSYRHLWSGISENAGPFPSTTRKLHQYWMPLLIMVTLYIPTYGMHELLYVCNTMFLSMDLFRSVMFCMERAFCTFWWALICYHYQYLFYNCMFLVFDYFLFLALCYFLISHHGYWKSLILPHQTPVLPPQFLKYFSTCHELLCIFLFFYLLTPFIPGFCTVTQND